ncbi:MAG: hypothetical protein WBD55_06795 [Dehalococcoidia bacterium]
MEWGLTVGIVVVAFLFAFIAYIIMQETRTHRFWQRKVEEGDLEMIRQLVEGEVQHWRTERTPKGVPASVWQGIQGVELIEIAPEYLRASTTAEAQFAQVGGGRRQISSALDEAKRVTAKLAERLLYDIPHILPERVQIDVYSTFHETGIEPTQRCILTTVAERAAAGDIDWDNDPPEAIAERLGARYELDARGGAVPVEPEGGAAHVNKNGSGVEPAL